MCAQQDTHVGVVVVVVVVGFNLNKNVAKLVVVVVVDLWKREWVVAFGTQTYTDSVLKQRRNHEAHASLYLFTFFIIIIVEKSS